MIKCHNFNIHGLVPNSFLSSQAHTFSMALVLTYLEVIFYLLSD